jgi:pimeloyl-ACP methyl ester carboxylesterase
MSNASACAWRRRRRAWAVTVVMAIAVLSGCGSTDDAADDPSSAAPEPTATADASQGSSEPSSGATPAKALRSFYEQRLEWEGCGSEQDCAEVEVPLDYSDPTGETVTLELRRSPAEGQARGTLFVNPGGPGGSGVDFTSYFVGEAGEDVVAGYDVVGFDPRGVGTSEPLECLGTEEMDRYVSSDPDPDDAAEAEDFIASVKALGKGCVRNSGALAAHVSTQEVARDLDVLRAVVGDEKLTYYGASYGTYIGATYAELFPEQVGRMVLDGAVDPTLSNTDTNLEQARGFETALRAYAADCVEQGDCPLGESQDAVVERIGQLLKDLDESPMSTDDPERPLTQALGFYGVALPLYDEGSWGYLTQGLEAALAGNGGVLLLFADQYLSRTESGYSDNSAEVISAVNCLDKPVDTTADDVEATIPDFEAASPTFGRVFAWSVAGCGAWPVRPPLEPLESYDAEGAAPIVVVGTTRDPATPYEWAVSLAQQLSSGVLVTRDGDGHTGYGQGNDCVDSAVDQYLVDGKVPADGLGC